MQPLKMLSRNTLTLLLSNTGSAVLAFGLSVLIGRVLGKEGLGVYTAALAWVFPLSLVAEFGIGTLMTREAARSPQVESSYLRLAAQLRLWLGSSLMLLLWVIAPLLSDDPPVIEGLRIAAPLILITPLFGNYTAIFRARQQMWPIPWLNLGMLVAQVALTILVFIVGGNILHALLVNTLTSALQLAAAWWVWRRWFKPPTAAAEPPALLIRDMFRQAWPFALAGILAALQLRLAPILLEKLSDTGSIGYYAAAGRFVEAGRTIPNALFGALFPLLATLVTQPDKLRQTFRKVMLGLAAFSGLLAIAFTLLSPFILSVTYGADFTAAASTLQISMWALVPSLLRAGLTLYGYAHGREQVVNRVVAVMLVVQFALSLWLIPTYSAYGAALAVLGSELFGVILLALPFRQR